MEFRMLFFLGKDVARWIDQCIDWAGNQPTLTHADDLRPQSSAGLLTASPPEPVKAKLLAWGVADHSAIFARAIGIKYRLRRTARSYRPGRGVPSY